MKSWKHDRLLVIVALVVMGLFSIFTGGKSYYESDKIAKIFSDSEMIMLTGHKTIDEWKKEYNVRNILIIVAGIGFIGVACGVALWKRK